MSKETVIVVHGTGAAPERGVTKWYQPGGGDSGSENFVRKLDAALQARGSSAKCWAHCVEGDQIFSWSGQNSWIARRRAAARLGQYVAVLRNDGWRCHIVAHSHGGNVVVEALPQIVGGGMLVGRPGNIVTIGTPFIDTITPMYKRGRLATRRIIVVGIISSILAIPWYIWRLNVTKDDHVIIFTGLFVVLSLLAYLTYSEWPQIRRLISELSNTPSNLIPIGDALPSDVRPQLLAIGSTKDEAWQVLHHIRTAENPIKVKSGLLSYLKCGFVEQMKVGDDTDVILGLGRLNEKSTFSKMKIVLGSATYSLILVIFLYLGLVELGDFLKDKPLYLAIAVVVAFSTAFIAYSLGFNWLGTQRVYAAYTSSQPTRFGNVNDLKSIMLLNHVTGSIIGIIANFTTYIIRRSIWRILVMTAMGLEGYRFGVPTIEQSPGNAGDTLITCEKMPIDAEKRALSRRGEWVRRHLGDVTEAFSNLVVTADDINSLLRVIEEDESLIHGAYYTDVDCIARIADWIVSATPRNSSNAQ